MLLLSFLISKRLLKQLPLGMLMGVGMSALAASFESGENQKKLEKSEPIIAEAYLKISAHTEPRLDPSAAYKEVDIYKRRSKDITSDLEPSDIEEEDARILTSEKERLRDEQSARDEEKEIERIRSQEEARSAKASKEAIAREEASEIQSAKNKLEEYKMQEDLKKEVQSDIRDIPGVDEEILKLRGLSDEVDEDFNLDTDAN